MFQGLPHIIVLGDCVLLRSTQIDLLIIVKLHYLFVINLRLSKISFQLFAFKESLVTTFLLEVRPSNIAGIVETFAKVKFAYTTFLEVKISQTLYIYLDLRNKIF